MCLQIGDLLSITLNEDQRQAVEHSGSPLLVAAGSGSGKEQYQIAFYLNEYRLKMGFAILPYSKEENKQFIKWSAPNQNIEFFIKFINIDHVLNLIYSDHDNSSDLKKIVQNLFKIPE